MSVSLFDTRLGTIVPFEAGPVVKMYTCGITPYDSAHIGHAAVYLYYDVLQRRLRDLGHDTQCVRNVTDIDDDMFRKARELGVDYRDLADEQTQQFDAAMRALNLLPSFSDPRASSAIADILGFIGMVLEGGYAYQSGGGVYFSVSKSLEFGQLSHLDREAMLKLADERGGNINDANKVDPLDFVLWQPSLPDEPAWESLWGLGRPGWHIECSALALRELGTTVDLHGGGADLVFPHHECERAQSEAATGETFVRHWMHVAYVRYQGEKMSKSLGNLVFINDLLNDWHPDVVRAAILANNYRFEWEWNSELLDAARARVQIWRESGAGEAALEEVRDALDNDLDTATALDLLDAAAKSGSGVSRAAELLGFRLSN